MKHFDAGISLLNFVVIFGFIAGLLLIVNHFYDPITYLKLQKDIWRAKDLSKVQDALETYYSQVRSYPPSDSLYRIVDFNKEPVVWGTSWMPFLKKMPIDPDYPKKQYVYLRSPDGQAYFLYASLDVGGKDMPFCKQNATSCDNAPLPSRLDMYYACGGACNYGVSSKNVTP